MTQSTPPSAPARAKTKFKAKRRKPQPRVEPTTLADLTPAERSEVETLLQMNEDDFRDSVRRFLIFPDRTGNRVFSCDALFEYTSVALLQLTELNNRAERSSVTPRDNASRLRAQIRYAHYRARAVAFHRQLLAKKTGNPLRKQAEALLGEALPELITSIQRDLEAGKVAKVAKQELRRRIEAALDARRASVERRTMAERIVGDVYYQELTRRVMADLGRGMTEADARRALETRKRRDQKGTPPSR
ncbi:hypothetical protein [Microbispora sp. NPDC049125]|uniref:hypothetical protein n=1 Tax=Microbispora sp. NPDC049125 TaxID=3154929 RepID=UPI003467A120